MKARYPALTGMTLLLGSICFAQFPNQTPNLLGSRGKVIATQMGSVSGIVVGSDGAPLSDVRVEVRDEQTGQAVASGYTNNGGGFDFQNLPASGYDIVATHGLAQTQERVDVQDGARNLRIRLNTANASAAQADGGATVSVAEYKVPKKARDAFHKAQSAMAKNRSEEVSKQLANSLEAYPDYAPALTLRGVLALDAGNTQAAVQDFDHAIHSDPSYALAYTTMAAASNQLNKFDDAIRSADRAITLSPTSWQSYFELAKAHVGKVDYQRALQDLAKAQALSPKEYAPIHLVRAHVMLSLKDYGNAMNELQAFLTMAPEDPNSAAARKALDKVKAFTSSAATPSPMTAAR